MVPRPVTWPAGGAFPADGRDNSGCRGSAGVMDAITLLKDDHKTVESLFKQFEKAGDRAVKTKRQLADQMIKELTTHAYIEETLFYPAAPGTAEHVLESIEEHHVVVWMLSELAGMDPADERFTAKVTVLIENVRHHVKEEEQDWFPQVRKAMGSKALRQLGEELAAAKSRAPSDPLKNITATA
jgi:hemerythrin superfamily protein